MMSKNLIIVGGFVKSYFSQFRKLFIVKFSAKHY